MKIALIQMESGDDKAQNEAKAFSFLEEAAEYEPDVICLPEKFLYWGKEKHQGKIITSDLEKYRSFAQKKGVNLILGSLATAVEGSEKTTNTSFVIDRCGEIVGRYDKKYMYVANLPTFKNNEAETVVPGTSPGIVTLDGIKVGIGICVDLRYPEYFRELTALGAEVIFLPSHFFESTGKVAWEILTRARAIENQVYFCACNGTGKRLCAGTKVIDYAGRVAASLEREEGVLLAELDFKAQEKYRKELPALQQMQTSHLI